MKKALDQELCSFMDANLKGWAYWYTNRKLSVGGIGWANKSTLADWDMPRCGSVYDGIEASFDRNQQAEELHGTINTALSKLEQNVIMHYYLSGKHSLRYVARQMRIHHNTVKKLMALAFNKLKLSLVTRYEVAA